jgi:transposase
MMLLFPISIQQEEKMPGKRSETMDVREILRHLRAKESDRAIARATQIDRKTVARYRTWATEQELLTGPLPTLGELQRLLSEKMEGPPPPQNESSVEPYRDLVVKLRRGKIEMTAIWERLKERGYSGSYSAVYRFVRHLEPLAPEVTVRVETKPGEEAQVDFGSVGLLIDPVTGELRKAYAFVMTLSWSRHQYVEFVFDQSVATWRVVTDNLKAAVARACWTEPEAQQSYRECAEHYGFLIGPCRPYTPQHKGKVESGVHYVQRNFMGGREPTPLPQANRDVQRWVLTTAGMRLHGTIRERPLLQFDLERSVLRPLPATPYDLAIWKQAKLHRDCYVVFENAYYSAPFRLVGQLLWVRGGCQDVQLFTTDYQLVTTHPRAQRPGQRLTQLDHLPPEKLPGLLLDREECRRRAMAVGPATQSVVERLLAHRPEDRLRSAARLLRMLDRVGPLRLEAACARALRFDDISYVTIKRILDHGLENEDIPETAPAASTACFERSVAELVGDLLGGAQWN